MPPEALTLQHTFRHALRGCWCRCCASPLSQLCINLLRMFVCPHCIQDGTSTRDNCARCFVHARHVGLQGTEMYTRLLSIRGKGAAELVSAANSTMATPAKAGAAKDASCGCEPAPAPAGKVVVGVPLVLSSPPAALVMSAVPAGGQFLKRAEVRVRG
jgi:hypothetical protein